MSAARGEAVSYHRRGLCPIPVKERSKQTSLAQLAPYLSKRATKEELSSWSWPGVGIVTGPVSGILVLDVDGPEGEAELKKYGHPITPMVRTSSGGLHLYFRHPDVDVRTGIRVAPGLDVKATGGYVVAPPSIGPNDKPYEWLVSLDDAEPADPPEWLMQLLERPERNGTAGPVGDRIPPGQRNKELTSLAGSMRRRGMGAAEILAALEVTNERRCEPPLETAELEKIAESVSRYEPAGDVISISFGGRDGGAPPPERFHLTEMGNAERFIAQHGENVRYCKPWEKWLVYTGSRWERDETMLVNRLAKETVRGIYHEAATAETEEGRKALAKHAAKSESAAAIKAMLELARHEVPVVPDELDAHPHLINALNGTVDLRSGELREHRREDLLTKMAGAEYHRDSEAPTWEAFLKRVLPSEDLRGFVHRASGYSATGDTSEQCILINHGGGANGKSTFQETLAAALGDYATRTPTDMLMARRFNGVPNDVARLKGARFVAASETEEGRRLDEARIKDLTGQDTVSARYMRGEWFDFAPTHKLWLSTNHKPEIRGTDNAIWRRIRLVSWGVTIPLAEQDRKLPEKLRVELEGVLAWTVAGCLQWQRGGLRAPEEVRRATGEYRAEMDVLAAFLREECATVEGESTAATALYEAYKEWCGETGERAEKQRKFGERLKERGYEKQRITSGANKGKFEYLDIALIRGPAKVRVGGEPLGKPDGSGEQSFTRGSTVENTSKSRETSGVGGRASEQSEPKNGISAGEIEPHGVISEKGSLHSLHSPLPSETEEALEKQDVLTQLARPGTGPQKTARTYLAGETKLEYVVRSVLFARGLGTEGWERYKPVVEEALEEWGSRDA